MAARITAYLVALIVGTTLIAGLIVGAQRDDDGPVDLIVVNGSVYTSDVENPTAEAVAVQGNKILMVGSNRDVQRLRRAQTVVVDAKGGAVLPGFNDSHLHLLSGGLAMQQVNLLDARTLPQINETVTAWAKTNPDREWVLGGGWNYEAFPGGLPTRQMLDALVPDRPAYLLAHDGNTGWANSTALTLAGIDRRRANPVDGVIIKDSRTGEPTGILKDAAVDLITALLPQPTREERLAALRLAMDQAHRRGITSVQNAGGTADDISLFDDLRRTQQLDVRVYAALSVQPGLSAQELDAYDKLHQKYDDDPVFKTGAVKLTVDGDVESHTAAMLEPYSNRAEASGEPRVDAEVLNNTVADLDRRGWQIMIHAVGDRAIRMALDAFDYATSHNPEPARGRRHRIEHAETPAAADISRFGTGGVIASMQPAHGLPDPSQIEAWTARMGSERAARGWPYGSIAKAGGKLAFGSDWPSTSMDPLLGLHVAVNRTTPQGEPEGGWTPSERLALRPAIDAYTSEAAWASFDEHRKGTLKRGMLADIVILSQDIFSVAPSRLAETDVSITIFDGKIVFSRGAATND